MGEPISERDLRDIRDAIFAGRKIEPIKLYRKYSGLGLGEAKDAVEEIEKKLRSESPERFLVNQPKGEKQVEAKSTKSLPGVQAGKGCFGMVVGVVLLMAVIVWIVVAF